MADRLFVNLYTDPSPPAPDENGNPAVRSELLQQLVEIVGARNRPDEVGRVLDVLAVEAARPGDSPGFNRGDHLVLGLARSSRRSVGQLLVGPDPARPGARLVAHLVQRARTIALERPGS